MQRILLNICDKNIKNNLELLKQNTELGISQFEDDYVISNSVKTSL